MQVLTLNEIEQVSGAADWNQIQTGMGAFGLSLAIASTPVGWVGIAGAALLAGAGGYNVGTGMMKP